MAIDKKFRKDFLACLRQKKDIEKKYDWCKCEILCQKTLICEGWIQPDEHCPSYKIRVRYRPGIAPNVYVLEPQIQMTATTHVYADGNLCLFYPETQPWKDETLIAESILPWTAEWLLYYEIYLISGVWEGPEIVH